MAVRTGPAWRRAVPYVVVGVFAVVVIAAVRWVFVGAPLPSFGGGCGGDAITLTVASSPEKAGLMRGFAEDYSGTDIDEGCVEVEIVEQASGATMEALGAGTWDAEELGPEPDVWTPASSSWLQLARDRRAAEDLPALLPDAAPSIANSPLVIAMPRPMAEALGWPDASLGWHDVLDLAEDEEGWASHGHAEWGAFRLGKTNPNYSTAGLNATIGTYFAATGLTSDLTDDRIDAAETRGFVAAVERSIVHYGDTTLTFLSNLRRADAEGHGLSYISAVAVEEVSVLHYNEGNPTGDPATAGDHPAPDVPLVAVYPDEGTLMSDHPYAVLSSAEGPVAAAAEGFREHLLSADVQAAFQDAGFRDHEGTPGADVTPENGMLPDQPAQLLNPPSSGALDGMLANWAELRKPANVLLVMDTSGSMQEAVAGTGQNKLGLAKEAALASLEQFGDSDHLGLWMFSTELDGDRDHRELVPLGPMDGDVGGTPRPDALAEEIEALPPGGGTGLYDTALAAHGLVDGERRDDAINAVVFLTDGRNEDLSGIGLDTLLAGIEGSSETGEAPVRVFTIGYGDDSDMETLTRIAEATDAAAYDATDPASIDEIFEAVVSNF
ncbi:substrate-binding and VWA domain-containing protein [Nocardiopsis trehalosi]|jgi:Ca-activated chloride channel family protein|uniref:substrate-binding and VWA domain-containing protein n=1 Tax=Nocardiopsis trehalosi TaxID=109329 RepID=UPI00082BFAB8|nr:substrate-binding and VWA domain-containing protein [Nocardiopsis trehalosi]